jgi:hypothetical protein
MNLTPVLLHLTRFSRPYLLELYVHRWADTRMSWQAWVQPVRAFLVAW